MAFLKNMYQKLLGEEVDDVTDAEAADASEEGFDEEATANMVEEKKGKAGSAHSLELKIAKLSAFDGNVMEVADHLIAGGPVVLNLDAASKDAVKRIIDFFSGVAYSVKGQLKNISGNIYIVTPASVDVSNDSKMFAGAKGTAKAEDASHNNNNSPYAGF
ncbi:MAG: cell division protein SepF [Clostridia bacterium]|nr:cell division protein SepF [Clostridia bacterium]